MEGQAGCDVDDDNGIRAENIVTATVVGVSMPMIHQVVICAYSIFIEIYRICANHTLPIRLAQENIPTDNVLILPH